MLHIPSSGELTRENLHTRFNLHTHPPSSHFKLQSLHTQQNARVFHSFSSYDYPKPSLETPDFSFQSKARRISNRDVNLSTQKGLVKCSRVYPGFKLQVQSRTGVLVGRRKDDGKRKSYGGVLPSVLKSLEEDVDVESALNSYYGKLSPKEETVILKEQRSWDRVLAVFEWMKSQEGYVPNAIHYNVVLRALGRAQKWDELRICWIDMAKACVLPTNNTYGMLIDVYGRAGLVKEALLWIRHMMLRGIFPDEVTMNTVVRVLKDWGEYDRADHFYKDWCNGKIELDELELDSVAEFESGSNLNAISLKQFLLTELFRTGGRSFPNNTTITTLLDFENSVQKPRLSTTYNNLIDLYGKAGRLKDAAKAFDEMLKSGVPVDTTTFNTMIYTCGTHGLLAEAESLFSKMEEKGLQPDTKTYNIFLSLYAGSGNLSAALEYYRKIREVGLFPDAVTRRAVLHVLCEKKMVREVEAVMEEIEKSKLQIDVQSLPVIIKMYVEEGLIERAKFLFETCQSGGGFVSKTYAAIINVYADQGLWAEAETIFFCKRDSVRQKKDVIEYNVMIKAYGKAKLYDKAFSLFKGMKNQGIWPDECTYNSLIQMFSGENLAEAARNILGEMRKMGFKPSCHAFSSLIASYSRLNLLPSAVEIYNEMVAVGVKPNEVVLGSLIDGFAENGKVDEALFYYREMEGFGISANKVILTSLIKAYRKGGMVEEAKFVFDKVKDLEGGLDIVASNSMLGLFADLGMVSEANSIFGSLKKGKIADGISYATMMYLYKNMSMIDEAIEVAEDMKSSGLLLDCISFNKAMACYAAKGQLVKCGELLTEMESRGILPDKMTLKVLFTVLRKGGLSNKAAAQLEFAYREGKPHARQAIITSVFSVVGFHDFAIEVCERFTKLEKELDLFAYNVAIYAYGASGKAEEALKVLMKLQDVGLEPDTVTYINLVFCYGKAGMVEGVKRVYSMLKYGEIEANDSLFEAIAGAYRRVNRLDLAELVDQEARLAFDTETFGAESETDMASETDGDPDVTL